jgi:hypothetical protein
MIAEVEEAVFSSSRTTCLELLAIVELCSSDRHILLTDPVWDPGNLPIIDAWLASWPQPLGAEIKLVLDEGPVAFARRTKTTSRIRIVDAVASDFRHAIPLLTVSDALRVLSAPLRLLLENGRNDGAFLKKMIPPQWRQSFIDALESRWAELETGGGITELALRVKQLAKDPRAWMRLWVMFDSDARDPNVPSTQSVRAAAACASCTEPWSVVPLQLGRRAIENYLPPTALFGWAELASGPEKKRRREAAEAFRDLSPAQRAHYNMKSGLFGELPRQRREWYIQQQSTQLQPQDLEPLFRALPEESVRRLHSGFGPDVASLYGDDVVLSEAMLAREISHQERAALLQSLFDRM